MATDGEAVRKRGEIKIQKTGEKKGRSEGLD